MNDDLMPADELGQLLGTYGNVPVKIRVTDPETGEVLTTLLERKHIVIGGKSAAGTVYGDIDRVCRLDVTLVDNA